MTGDYRGAAGDLEQALTIYRDLGIRASEPEALNETGTLHLTSREPAEAEACHQQALDRPIGIPGSSDSPERVITVVPAWHAAGPLNPLGRRVQRSVAGAYAQLSGWP